MQPHPGPEQPRSKDQVDGQHVQPELSEDQARQPGQELPLANATSTIGSIPKNTMPINNLKLQEIFKSSQSEINNHLENFSAIQADGMDSAPHSSQ